MTRNGTWALAARALPLVLLMATEAGAAVPRLEARWLEPSELAVPSPERYRDHGAVVVYRERHIQMINRWGDDSVTRVLDHAAVAILDRSGQGHANVRVPYRGDWKVTEFRARTVGRDGSVHEVSAEGIYDDVLVDGADEDKGWRVKIYAFPHVEPGDVLEYRYVIEQPYFREHYWEYCVGDLPVIRYDLAVQVTAETVLLLKIYNTRQEIARTEEDGFVTLRWTMRDLFPPPDEPWSPARQFRSPWWLASVVQFTRGQSIIHLSTRWEHALRRMFHRLAREPGDDLKGYRAPLTLRPGEGRRSALRRAFEWVRDTPAFDGYEGFGDLEVLADSLAIRRAGSHQQARLLHQVLADLGVKADVAFLRRWQDGVFDRSVPATVWLDHMVVRVPAQPGIEEPLWLDPSCRYCDPGMLPQQDLGVDAVVMGMDPGPLQELPAVRIERTDAPVAAPDGTRRTWDLVVDGTGRVTGSVEVALTGEPGASWARDARDQAPGARREHLEEVLLARFPGAVLESFDEFLGTGPDETVRYRLHFAADRVAASAPGEVVLPLAFLWSSRERITWPRKRTQGFVVRRPEEIHDDVHVRGPAGWQARVDPLDGRTEGEAAAAEARVSAVGDGMIRASRTLSLRRGAWSPERYADLPQALARFSQVKRVALRWEAPPTPAAPAVTAPPARGSSRASPRRR